MKIKLPYTLFYLFGLFLGFWALSVIFMVEVVVPESAFADSQKNVLRQVCNDKGLPIYYYLDVNQYPCNDSVCSIMHVRLYWDLWGNYLSMGLEEGKALTKIGHKSFTDKDYEKLHVLLNDAACNLQYYELEELTDKESEVVYNSYDAISGATIQSVQYESVRGAVKTCYTLWRIVHDSIPEQIRHTTEIALRTVQSNEDSALHHLMTDASQVAAQMPGLLEEDEVIPLTALAQLRKTTVSKAVLQGLSAHLNGDREILQTAIYNFLLQKNYRDKSVRKYTPTHYIWPDKALITNNY